MGFNDYDHEAGKHKNGPPESSKGSKKNPPSRYEKGPTNAEKKQNGENKRYDEKWKPGK